MEKNREFDISGMGDGFKMQFFLSTIFTAEPFYNRCNHFLMPINPAEFTDSLEAQKVLEDLNSRSVTYHQVVDNLRECVQVRFFPEIAFEVLQTIERGYLRLEEIAQGNVKACCDRPAPGYVRRSPEYQARIREAANHPVARLKR